MTRSGWLFFRRRLTICIKTVFPHSITFWTRLMFNLVRVGKERAGPVFPHPLTSNFRFYAYSWQGKVGWVFPHPINHMHNSFSPPDTFCIRLMFNHVMMGKEWAGPVFPYPLKSKGWLCWGLTSQSTIFQSCRDGAIASWVSNQYFRGVKCLAQGHNTAAIGLEPRTSRSEVRHSTTEPPRSPKKQRLLVYSWQGKVGYVIPQTINHTHNSFSPADNLLNKVDV